MKVAFVMTASLALTSLHRGQFEFFQRNGITVIALAGPGSEHELLKARGINCLSIPIVRQISPLKDILALVYLTFYFIQNRFDLVVVSTPKASLLAAIAAFLTAQKKSIFIVRGRVYENETGLKYKFFKSVDKFISQLTDKTLFISQGLRDEMVSSGVVRSNKAVLLGKGSSNGVDLTKFDHKKVKEFRLSARAELKLSETDIIIGYTGRIVHDKGIDELVKVFCKLQFLKENLYLILQGVFEENNKVSDETIKIIKNNNSIITKDWSQDPERLMAAFDIFCLPSHREGFGNVALEANALGIPVIASDILGLREAVENSNTGLLFEKKNEADLEAKLLTLITNKEMRERLGRAGVKRAANYFSSVSVWENLLNFYKSEISSGQKT